MRRGFPFDLSLFSLFVVTSTLCAQPRLVTDLNRAPGPPVSSSPRDFFAVADRVYFSAFNALVGRELWAVDAQGVSLVGNVAAGAESSNPRHLVAFGGGVAFLADTPFRGADLYVVRQGLAQRVTTGLRSINPTRLVASGNRLFLFADDGVNGSELWVSDGTAAGTRMVSDIVPGAGGAEPVAMVPFRDGVAMFLDDGVHGLELWVSLGVNPVTRLVRDLNPGSAIGAAFPHSPPAVFGGELYFAGDDGSSGRELWASDGTNMRQVADIVPGPDSSAVYEPFAFGGGVAFGIEPFPSLGTYPSRPWITDGSTAGTRALTSAALPNPRHFTSLTGGRFLFVTFGGSNLVVSDGTAAGTTVLAGPGEDVRRIYSAGPNAYITTNRPRVFVTDGTAAATVLLPSDATFQGAMVGRVDGSAVFAGSRSTEGDELWIAEGSPVRARLLADIESTPTTDNARPRFLGGIGGRAVFAAGTERGHELFASDGTPAGTRILTALGGTSNLPAPTPVAALNDALFLYDEQGRRILRTDGTSTGTWSIGALVIPNARLVGPVGGALGGRVLFSAGMSTASSQLWISDGSANGAQVLLDINPGSQAGAAWFTRERGRMFFIATDPAAGRELWVSDGTSVGTRLVADVQPLGAVDSALISVLGVCNGKVVFTPSDGVHGRELWASDGTAAGTQLLSDLTPGSRSTTFWEERSVTFGGRLLFVTSTGTYSTDGTAAGTQALPLPANVWTNMVALGDKVVAFCTEGASTVMFTTDGTAFGTRRVGYVFPNSFFRVTAAISATEAVATSVDVSEASWFVTDGTLAGTRALGSARGFNHGTLVDGRHYFEARHPTLGAELFVLDLGAAAMQEGLGCGAVADAVRLRASSPRLGANMRVDLASPWLVHALLLGRPALVPVALSLPAAGCALFVDPSLFATVALPGTSLSIPLPNRLDFLGVRLAAQAISGPSTAGIDLSNGVRLVLDR